MIPSQVQKLSLGTLNAGKLLGPFQSLLWLDAGLLKLNADTDLNQSWPLMMTQPPNPA